MLGRLDAARELFETERILQILSLEILRPDSGFPGDRGGFLLWFNIDAQVDEFRGRCVSHMSGVPMRIAGAHQCAGWHPWHKYDHVTQSVVQGFCPILCSSPQGGLNA